jgi:hypothetical protein
MFRLLAASWLTRRVAGPLSRAIPNPILRFTAIAGAGILATRLFKSVAERSTPGPPGLPRYVESDRRLHARFRPPDWADCRLPGATTK